MESIHKPNRIKKRFFLFPLFFLAGLFAVSAVVMLLWNAIIPTISGITPLSYWQAMGLFVLCRILFGGFKFSRHRNAHRHFAHHGFKDKFMDMNDEEKQQFKNQWKQRCCK